MPVLLDDLFERIVAPTISDTGKPLYAVLPVAGYQSYFLGKDGDSCACLLIGTEGVSKRRFAPIRLENLEVQFELPCYFQKAHDPKQEGKFTVICCRSQDPETIRYFLSICGTVLQMLGDKPTQSEIASAVHRIAAIFQKTHKPPLRTVNGLFGELYLIFISENPPKTLSAWRVDDRARFDFVDGRVRLDVKTTTGRVRAHTFSYEQCNPPHGVLAVIASLFVERVSSGLTLRALVDGIAELVSPQIDLVLKLHETVASTLGTSLNEAMSLAFDEKIARSSLCFYDIASMPAIRTPLPTGVSDVHFRSDLSHVTAVSIVDLIAQDSSCFGLLPKQNN